VQIRHFPRPEGGTVVSPRTRHRPASELAPSFSCLPLLVVQGLSFQLLCQLRSPTMEVATEAGPLSPRENMCSARPTSHTLMTTKQSGFNFVALGMWGGLASPCVRYESVQWTRLCLRSADTAIHSDDPRELHTCGELPLTITSVPPWLPHIHHRTTQHHWRNALTPKQRPHHRVTTRHVVMPFFPFYPYLWMDSMLVTDPRIGCLLFPSFLPIRTFVSPPPSFLGSVILPIHLLEAPILMIICSHLYHRSPVLPP
jgi:hypothetical protein